MVHNNEQEKGGENSRRHNTPPLTDFSLPSSPNRMMLALYAINFHSTFLQFDRLLFNAFKGGDDADDDRKGNMEEGILLINRVYLSTPQLLNPTLVDGVKSTLDSLADQVRALLPPSAKADPMDCFVACKKVLFDFGLRGNAADYYNINNSLLR